MSAGASAGARSTISGAAVSSRFSRPMEAAPRSKMFTTQPSAIIGQMSPEEVREGVEGADVEPPGQDVAAAQPEDEQEGDAEEQPERRPEQSLEADEAAVLLDVVAVEDVEGALLRFLLQ